MQTLRRLLGSKRKEEPEPQRKVSPTLRTHLTEEGFDWETGRIMIEARSDSTSELARQIAYNQPTEIPLDHELLGESFDFENFLMIAEDKDFIYFLATYDDFKDFVYKMPKNPIDHYKKHPKEGLDFIGSSIRF